ncbi:hypothetical protein [Pantoea sp. S62]|uniref:hypothetical protein n=1 Tax=Pantoea sp. S62 TaxID=2769342 RepID=UPI001912371B|nr:hypothetical protein [Pantoea sp. S62]MBK5017955.1 hypothetical protein [Pantoea sp. S62]
MYRTEDEKRADEKLGEAVLFLLREEMPVNEAALLRRLQQMLMTETDAASRKATFSAIREAEAALCMRNKKNGRVLKGSDASEFAGASAPGAAYRH